MIKCRIDDFLEIVVSVDITDLPDDIQESLLKQTAALAMAYAKELGHETGAAKVWDQIEDEPLDSEES